MAGADISRPFPFLSTFVGGAGFVTGVESWVLTAGVSGGGGAVTVGTSALIFEGPAAAGIMNNGLKAASVGNPDSDRGIDRDVSGAFARRPACESKRSLNQLTPATNGPQLTCLAPLNIFLCLFGRHLNPVSSAYIDLELVRMHHMANHAGFGVERYTSRPSCPSREG